MILSLVKEQKDESIYILTRIFKPHMQCWYECFISNNSWTQCRVYLKGYKDNHGVLNIERLEARNKKRICGQSRNGIEIITFVGICGWLYWGYYKYLTTSTTQNWMLAFPLGVKSWRMVYLLEHSVETQRGVRMKGWGWLKWLRYRNILM